MKTLDNLIKTLEEILPNPPSEGDLESEGYYIQKDIIHYCHHHHYSMEPFFYFQKMCPGQPFP